MPIKHVSKIQLSKKRSIWHQEVPPPITYSLVGILGFLAGALILGAVAAQADTDTEPNDLARSIRELGVTTNLLTKRLDRVEERLDALDGGDAETAPTPADCETLKSILPILPTMRLAPSSVECFQAPGVNHPDKKFLSVAGIYQYTAASGEIRELTLQIYDMNGNSEAIESFTTKGAYNPVDYDRVKREPIAINGAEGVLTYDGIVSNETFYMRPAYWLIVANRFGILIHGSPLRNTDERKLYELASAIDFQQLERIR